jgi:hypothetical protein
MVIPQQDKLELLQLNQEPHLPYMVEAVKSKELKVTVQYESLYGQAWVITYPEVSYQQID